MPASLSSLSPSLIEESWEFRVCVSWDESRGLWHAKCLEKPQCEAEAETEDEALEAVADQLVALVDDEDVVEPTPEPA